MACSCGNGKNGPNVTASPPSATPSSQLSPRFVDVAESAGLSYRWQVQGKRPLNILQTIGDGCAFLDYDDDGNLDVLLVGPRLAMYRGDGHGRFTDVTRTVGLDKISGHFLGCAVGDYDNDGYEDIYISGYRTGVLLHNNHGHDFSEVTRQAGVKPQPWGTACTWAETVPGSGRLDLLICNYARFGTELGIPQLCESRGIPTSCGPRYYTPLKGVFYRNLGHGRFEEADQALNLASTRGRGLGAAFAPLDSSMRPTLALANDEMPGDLLTPAVHGNAAHYANSGASSGVATDRDGNIHGGMGADWGDYDSDGRFDLFVGTYQGEAKSLYHNDGNGSFSDSSYLTGIAPIAMSNVTFGCKLFDFDNDGALDLILANGHVQDNIHAIDSSTTYRQPTLLLHNRGGTPATFENVSMSAGADIQRPIVGRGLAVGDYDNDGRVDVLVVDSEGAPLLLHNETTPAGHWLGVKLVGVRSNRDGIGAILTASIGGRTLTRLCHTDGSYLSASDKRVSFGLGTAKLVNALTIRWPDGHTDVFKSVAGDRYVTVHEAGALSGGQ